MNQITIDNILLVEVPGDAEKFVVDMGYLIWKTVDKSDWITDKDLAEDLHRFLKTGKSRFDGADAGIKRLTDGAMLPAGNWIFIATTDYVNAEMAAKIVEKQRDGYKEYEVDGPMKNVPHFYAVDSYQSWLRANKIPSDKRFAILKLNP